MIFNEQTAKEVIEKFGLNKSMGSVWAHRGKIPERYFKDGFKIGTKAKGEQAKQAIKEYRRIASFGKLNFESICRLIGIKHSRFMDFIYNDIIATEEELLLLKKAINAIRIEARELLTELNKGKISEITQKKLKSFLKRDEIKVFVLIENKVLANTINDWLLGKRSVYPVEHQNAIEQALLVFITETSMLT